ncbi:TlpA family protein disulfide reductase [Zunongwangia pacifica]|uniref:TlpA family protein disulfide reductase n=1 Tax=Zunongwangia pacifica TaxID=2911062 RepID=A0A9X2CMC4_9FLAO|nr:TlpA disulfide reductase family protein [Zunongwangia pacifica]MCL6217334.1 TlpA family protein disulfide reductase [Zunongwangia pacifica]
MKQSLCAILISLLFNTYFLSAQETKTDSIKDKDKVFFSEALALHLADYNDKANFAYRKRDFKEAQRLFDSVTVNHLAGSYINNFKFNTLKGKEVHLYDFDKSIYLITYASWCIPGKGAIPAINEIAKKYKDQIQIVVLFWDTRDKVKKVSKEFNGDVKIVYVDETQNKSPYVVKQLKHSLGLPTCFLINKDKRIEDITRYTAVAYGTPIENALKKNFNQIDEGITSYLINYEDTELMKSRLASRKDKKE